MPTYEPIDQQTRILINNVMRQHHLGLAAADVQVAALFVYAPRDKEGFPNGHALTSAGGYAASAKIKKTTLKERVLGVGDALLLIDGDQWPEWPDDRRRALIDHELTHLQVKWQTPPETDEETGHVGGGLPETDDWNRPKLEIRLHDFQLGGFHSVVQRHGTKAFEMQLINETLDEGGQYLLPYLDGLERSVY